MPQHRRCTTATNFRTHPGSHPTPDHRELLSPLTRKLFGTQCTWRLADVDAHKMPNAVKDVDGGDGDGGGDGAPPTSDTPRPFPAFPTFPRKSHQAIFLRTLASGSGIMRFGN